LTKGAVGEYLDSFSHVKELLNATEEANRAVRIAISTPESETLTATMRSIEVLRNRLPSKANVNAQG
jgi:hypothetical protein